MKKYNIKVNGKEYEVEVEQIGSDGVAVAPVAAPVAAAAPAPTAAPAAAADSQVTGSETIKAPMPGTILRIEVSKGDSVKSGQVLCVLEAMKMENEIVAPVDGTVASINVAQGASVDSGDVLVSLN